MSNKPIFVATHPRSCSTAFERVFMTRKDSLHCVHEPFGDAFYYGPERLSERFADDEVGRLKSGFSEITYKDVVDSLLRDVEESKLKNQRVFIKDIIYYLFAPDQKPTYIAPSLAHLADSPADNLKDTPNGVNGTNGTNGTHTEEKRGGGAKNPTVLPTSLLRKFHFTFLIRHPRRAIPSYYRCTIPPLDKVTGFYEFLPSEAGYSELRRLFDFLKDQGIVGPASSNSNGTSATTNGHTNLNGGGDKEPEIKITIIDADDLLDYPAEVIRQFCEEVGIEFTEEMLQWGDEEGQKKAESAFEKWKGFHEDALGSTGLKPRQDKGGVKKTPTQEEENAEWTEKYGEEAAKMIRECVDANVADYEYLKQWAFKL